MFHKQTAATASVVHPPTKYFLFANVTQHLDTVPRALSRQLQTSPHLNSVSYFISDCDLKGTSWLLEHWSLWLTPSYRRRLEEDCEPPAPANRGSDVRDSGRPTCEAVLLVPGVGNGWVGALWWVGGEQVKDALLSFLLSLWPFSGVTHFRKETLCYIRQSCLPAKSLLILCIPAHNCKVAPVDRIGFPL